MTQLLQSTVLFVYKILYEDTEILTQAGFAYVGLGELLLDFSLIMTALEYFLLLWWAFLKSSF